MLYKNVFFLSAPLLQQVMGTAPVQQPGQSSVDLKEGLGQLFQKVWPKLDDLSGSGVRHAFFRVTAGSRDLKDGMPTEEHEGQREALRQGFKDLSGPYQFDSFKVIPDEDEGTYSLRTLKHLLTKQCDKETHVHCWEIQQAAAADKLGSMEWGGRSTQIGVLGQQRNAQGNFGDFTWLTSNSGNNELIKQLKQNAEALGQKSACKLDGHVEFHRDACLEELEKLELHRHHHAGTGPWPKLQEDTLYVAISTFWYPMAMLGLKNDYGPWEEMMDKIDEAIRETCTSEWQGGKWFTNCYQALWTWHLMKKMYDASSDQAKATARIMFRDGVKYEGNELRTSWVPGMMLQTYQEELDQEAQEMSDVQETASDVHETAARLFKMMRKRLSGYVNARSTLQELEKIGRLPTEQKVQVLTSEHNRKTVLKYVIVKHMHAELKQLLAMLRTDQEREAVLFPANQDWTHLVRAKKDVEAMRALLQAVPCDTQVRLADLLLRYGAGRNRTDFESELRAVKEGTCLPCADQDWMVAFDIGSSSTKVWAAQKCAAGLRDIKRIDKVEPSLIQWATEQMQPAEADRLLRDQLVLESDGLLD